MLFGEGTPKSARFRAYVDGKLIEHTDPRTKQVLKEFDAASLAKTCGGNVHFNQVIAEGLDANIPHTLEIEPLFSADDQELRIASLCTAGS